MGAQATRLTLATTALMAALALPFATAQASVGSVTPSPVKAQVAATGAGSVAVTWRVNRSLVSLPVPGVIASANAQLFINGAAAGTISRRLEQSSAGETSAEILEFRETLRIPRSVIYRAIKQESPIIVRRVFDDIADSGSEDGELIVVPAGPGSEGFTVQRLSLSFGDDVRTRVLPRNSSLRAVAEINTTGAGLLSGKWQIAEGFTTAGTPVFRTLYEVRQGVGGGGRTIITSPRLPTSVEGSNLVRFLVTSPELRVEDQTLQYYVTPRSLAAGQQPLQEILVSGPRPGASLTDETVFAWSAMAAAKTYHLEIFATPAGPRKPADPNAVQANLPLDPGPETDAVKGQAALAGSFVPGDRTQTSLADFSVDHLPAGRSYFWKVSAIDANGAVIGSSSVREIFKP
ncbi:hypothetical protein [Pelagibius sp.]|uniref:hypothetical protein n=1 Tax=Pelagibius sp. TaxID=1931238 RepID=UPI003BB00505